MAAKVSWRGVALAVVLLDDVVVMVVFYKMWLVRCLEIKISLVYVRRQVGVMATKLAGVLAFFNNIYVP